MTGIILRQIVDGFYTDISKEILGEINCHYIL